MTDKIISMTVAICFQLTLISQINYYQELTYPDDSTFWVYSPLSSFMNPNENAVSFYAWNNGRLRCIEFNYQINDSVRIETKLLKYHPNGRIALSVADYRYIQLELDAQIIEVHSGNYTTYYKSGKLRSIYSIDSLGRRTGEYLVYKEDGKVLYKNKYINGALMDGQRFYTPNPVNWEIVHYEKYKNGRMVLKKTVNLKEGRIEGAFGKMRYKKLLKNFMFNYW